jgi:phosphoglycerate dehydrogenase-like enzyme
MDRAQVPKETVVRVVSTLPYNRLAASGVDFPPDWEVRYLGEREDAFGEEVIAAAGQDAQFLLLTPYPVVGASLMEKLPALKMIQMVGVGYDNVDTEAAAQAGVVVANSPGINATTVAEFTIGIIILLLRRVLEGDQAVRQGRWKEVREAFLAEGLEELGESLVGLAGLGNIGQRVARLALAFGSRVVYYDVERKTELERELGVSYLSLEELLSTADIVSLHLPLLPQTRNLIGERELALMKPRAVLINTSRGGLVDEAALVRAIEEGRIAGAAIDTFTQEPLPPDHPLLSLAPELSYRLLLTPHLAGVTRQSFGRGVKKAIENIARVARGEPPQYVVNGLDRPRR